MSDPFQVWWVKAISYALFASFGGVMGHLLRTIHKQEKINWGRTSVEGCSAAFVGVVVMLVCQAMAVSENWTGVIVGVCGWLGATATISLLEGMVRKKLGITEGRSDETSGQ